ncbi:TPA: MotA/TolQ/ExbB proton channel family protein [Candidatus Poribacteria bacterium]|nr:MotA/TolQ/ExbB proton channel family protein [Candidatus Poribacteria bacterium]
MSDFIIEGIKQLGRGGFLMIPLLFCSLIAHALILERLYSLRREKIIPSRFISRIYKLLEKGNTDSAIMLCESKPGPLTNIIKVGILNRDLNEEELKKVIEFASRPEKSSLEKYLRVIAFIGAVAVLIGLFGTVAGLFSSFSAIFKYVSRPETTAKIAGGISVALLTTVAGLAVAIPCIIAYSYLAHKVDSMINEITRHSMSIVKYLTSGDYKFIEQKSEKSEE